MWTGLLGNKTTWLAGCSMSLLVRSCVPTVLQQNMTIVQRDSCFRWETHSFLCVWMAPGQRATMILPPLPCEQLGAESWGAAAFMVRGLSLTRRALTGRESKANDLWSSLLVCLQHLWENDWMDGLVTQSQMTGWGGGGGGFKFQEMPGMKECRASVVMSRFVKDKLTTCLMLLVFN